MTCRTVYNILVLRSMLRPPGTSVAQISSSISTTTSRRSQQRPQVLQSQAPGSEAVRGVKEQRSGCINRARYARRAPLDLLSAFARWQGARCKVVAEGCLSPFPQRTRLLRRGGVKKGERESERARERESERARERERVGERARERERVGERARERESEERARDRRESERVVCHHPICKGNFYTQRISSLSTEEIGTSPS